MNTINKVFIIAHIRFYRRKLFKIEIRVLILFTFLYLLISFLLGVAKSSNPFEVAQLLIYLLLVIGLLYYWITSWVIANDRLKKAEESEIMHTKYKKD